MDFETLLVKMSNTIPTHFNQENTVFLCIGTDRSTGDSLAPIVGSNLIGYGYKNVYGTLDEPTHAMNLDEVFSSIPKGKNIIAIDACLGQVSSIGKISIHKGGIKAGAGVGKDIGRFGDYSITGVVNVGGFMEYFVLQNTRLSLVVNLANQITDLILHRFPIEIEKNDYSKNLLFA